MSVYIQGRGRKGFLFLEGYLLPPAPSRTGGIHPSLRPGQDPGRLCDASGIERTRTLIDLVADVNGEKYDCNADLIVIGKSPAVET